MSTLKADTIVASDGSSPVTLTKQSAAKAWVNFNGTGTIAARDSFNFSSLTDLGLGDYDINFSNNTGNSDYAYNVTSANTSSPYIMVFWTDNVANATTSKFGIGTLYVSNTSGGGTGTDAILVNGTVHGDLA